MAAGKPFLPPQPGLWRPPVRGGPRSPTAGAPMPEGRPEPDERAAPAGTSGIEDRLARLESLARSLRDLLWLQLLTQDSPAYAEPAGVLLGTDIEPTTDDQTYREVYVNRFNRPVQVQVFASWDQAGDGIKLSLTQSHGDGGVIDIMTNAALNGKDRSIPILLKPNQTLYARKWQTGVVQMSAATKFYVRIFDPTALLDMFGIK